MRAKVLFVGTLLSLIAIAAKSNAEIKYVVTDLGKLDIPPGVGNSLNSVGHVTGYSYITGEMYGHAFLYDNSMHDLGTLGGADSVGNGINDSGQVVGYSLTNTAGVQHAFLYDATQQDLGTLGGASSAGYGINASGQVTGYADTSSGGTHSFLWTPSVVNGNTGRMFDLGTLGGSLGTTFSTGYSINSSGQVTGWAETSTGESHAFVWSPNVANGTAGTMFDLGTFGGPRSGGNAIKTYGQVVGFAVTTEGDAVYHAFLWTPTTPNGTSGTMKDLGTFSGPQSNASGINDSGQVVGFSGLAGDLTEHAFVSTDATGDD